MYLISSEDNDWYILSSGSILIGEPTDQVGFEPTS